MSTPFFLFFRVFQPVLKINKPVDGVQYITEGIPGRRLYIGAEDLLLIPVKTSVKNIVKIMPAHIDPDFLHMRFHVLHRTQRMSDHFCQVPAASEPVKIFLPFFKQCFIKLLF